MPRDTVLNRSSLVAGSLASSTRRMYELHNGVGARENALSVKVDEMNLKYKSKGIVMEAGDNACWIEVKMMKRYQIVCPPSAAYPNMVTTRIRLANGTTANVTVPVRGVRARSARISLF